MVEYDSYFEIIDNEIAAVMKDSKISEKVKMLQSDALMELKNIIRYHCRDCKLDKIIRKICKQKIAFIRAAASKKELKQILSPSVPNFNGCSFTENQYHVKEEELLWWSQATMEAPLNDIGYKRYFELFEEIFGMPLDDIGKKPKASFFDEKRRNTEMNSKMQRINELVHSLNDYCNKYYNEGISKVPDDVYDRLIDELSALEQDTGYILSNSPTQKVGAEPVSSLPKSMHQIPLLSLDKTKSIEDFVKFIGDKSVMLMLKMDGLTVKLVYENGDLAEAATRGNGEQGEVITHNALHFMNIPVRLPYKKRLVVVGEAIIHTNDFEQLKEVAVNKKGEIYKTARNLVVGSVRAFDSNVCKYRKVHFIPFNVLEGLNEEIKNSKYAKLLLLKELGFDLCEMFYLPAKQLNESVGVFMELLKKSADKQHIPYDGITAIYDDIDFSESCGRTGHHYKDGLAFKYHDELYESILRSIEWTTTRTGIIAPVAVFEPVNIDGTEVTRATLHNVSFIEDLKLHVGNRILVSKRNMVIPCVEENLDRVDGDIEVPTVCPSCGTNTTLQVRRGKDGRNTKILICFNEKCPARNIRKLVHFVDKTAMNIVGLSEGTLEKLVGCGLVKSPLDIFQLKNHKDEICGLEGFGETAFNKLCDAVENSRKITLDRFLVAMDIPDIGKTASRLISKFFDGDIHKLQDAIFSKFPLIKIPGISQVQHQNFYDWFASESRVWLWFGLYKEVEIINPVNINIVKSNEFSGKTVVVTGTLCNYTRDDINTFLQELGATAGSTVTKKTDYVLVGEDPGSKLLKAKQYNIPILTENDFLEMVKEKGASLPSETFAGLKKNMK